MYDPVTARFLQEDTYSGDPSDPLSLNLYTYCHNEPLMYYDPTGHAEVVAGSKIAEDIIGASLKTLKVAKKVTAAGVFVKVVSIPQRPAGSESERISQANVLPGFTEEMRQNLRNAAYNEEEFVRLWTQYRNASITKNDLTMPDHIKNKYAAATPLPVLMMPTAVETGIDSYNKLKASSKTATVAIKGNTASFDLSQSKPTIFTSPGTVITGPTIFTSPGTTINGPTIFTSPGTTINGPTIFTSPGVTINEPTIFASPGTTINGPTILQANGGVSNQGFISKDKYVGEIATRIEATYPGSVKGVGLKEPGLNGLERELDIVLKDGTIIQVKEGNARNINGQLTKTRANFPGRRVIGVHPEQNSKIVKKEIVRSGNTSTDSIDDLIDNILKYLGR
jgi:hypothetical protein